ncbi:hypothetical protein PHSY_004109 [Pseudozyma hubeiensis SY62]|uniref:Uncharacterized protein n=1 Tax=Pseudozyma hubeiensis (strain SY62) TaxID=1305764 RepID=R9P5D4_PSEHS|nr:hypothetical protein PHSY_004109 [Pseudozyma hubeiensis SY62]GAC96529.1 hypothetical protein PHSY_004109 [Pseudozyma hubeiensis SY62]
MSTLEVFLVDPEPLRNSCTSADDGKLPHGNGETPAHVLVELSQPYEADIFDRTKVEVGRVDYLDAKLGKVVDGTSGGCGCGCGYGSRQSLSRGSVSEEVVESLHERRVELSDLLVKDSEPCKADIVDGTKVEVGRIDYLDVKLRKVVDEPGGGCGCRCGCGSRRAFVAALVC